MFFTLWSVTSNKSGNTDVCCSIVLVKTIINSQNCGQHAKVYCNGPVTPFCAIRGTSQKTNRFLSTAAVVLRMSERWTAFICWCLVCEEGTMGVSGSTGGTWWCPVQQDFAYVALRQVLVPMQEYLMHFICEFVHTYANLLCRAFHCPQRSYPLNFLRRKFVWNSQSFQFAPGLFQCFSFLSSFFLSPSLF